MGIYDDIIFERENPTTAVTNNEDDVRGIFMLLKILLLLFCVPRFFSGQVTALKMLPDFHEWNINVRL